MGLKSILFILFYLQLPFMGFMNRKCFMIKVFPRWFSGKEATCNAGDMGSIPVLGRFPWRRAWQPTPAFLPGESHGQRSLVGCNPWGHKESDMTEHTHTHIHTTESYFFVFLSASPSRDSSKPRPAWPCTTTNRRLSSAGSRGPRPISPGCFRRGSRCTPL